MNAETTIVLISIAVIAYGPWLVETIVREYRVRKAHYA